jgi:hypothetical protein
VQRDAEKTAPPETTQLIEEEMSEEDQAIIFDRLRNLGYIE